MSQNIKNELPARWHRKQATYARILRIWLCLQILFVSGIPRQTWKRSLFECVIPPGDTVSRRVSALGSRPAEPTARSLHRPRPSGAQALKRSGQAGQASGHTGRSYFGWCCGGRPATRYKAARGAGEGGRAGESSWRQTAARCLSALSPSRPKPTPPRSVPLAPAYGFARPNARRTGWRDRPINNERRVACLRARRLPTLEITFLLNTFVAVISLSRLDGATRSKLSRQSAWVCG